MPEIALNRSGVGATPRFYCSGSCRYHNIWSKDPTTGFELSDVIAHDSVFPENLENDHQYNVDVQWSASGYRVSISDLTANVPYSDIFYPVAVTPQTYDSWTWGYSVWGFGLYYNDETPAQHAAQWTAGVYGQGPTGVSGGGGDIRTDALNVMLTATSLASGSSSVGHATRQRAVSIRWKRLGFR
jgi:hypothetical protein